MKINLVRAFVLTLAFVGFGATAVSARTHANTPQVQVAATGGPVGVCLPSDPSYCGLGSQGGGGSSLR